MALGNPVAGGSVADYQISGIPWATGSLSINGIVKVKFPSVSKFFVVRNTGASNIRVGFTRDGVFTTNHFFTVVVSGTQQFDLRVRDLYFSGTGGTIDMFAGLTQIAYCFYPNLTGANPPPTGSQYLPGI